MSNNQSIFRTMPKHYTVCFQTECPLATKCLRRIVAQEGVLEDSVVFAVNPARHHGEKCKYFRENKMVRMAYGMVNSYEDVKARHIVRLRRAIINYFGRGSYYLRRNGKHAITPKEQQYIASVFSKYGYEVQFDSFKEEVQWDDIQ